jgi:hypothetical protein
MEVVLAFFLGMAFGFLLNGVVIPAAYNLTGHGRGRA